MELGDLLPELIEHILSFVPLKPRTRLKCVSKSWCNFITQIRHSTPQTTSQGLVLTLERHHPSSSDQIISSKTSFIAVKDHGKEGLEQTSLSITLPGVRLINSCNGLLLYAVKHGNYYTQFYVCSPITKQYIPLPRIHEVSTKAFAGIAFDGLQPNFKLICYDTRDTNLFHQTINCHIFSSQTGEWNKHIARVVNSSLSCLLAATFHCSSLYFEGELLFCTSNNCLLVYNVESNFFKLFQLPKFSYYNTPNLLLESEGRLYYCQQSGTIKFYIFPYVIDDNDDHGNLYTDYGILYEGWRLKADANILQLVTQVRAAVKALPSQTEDEELLSFFDGSFEVKPISFNDDLQILYLQMFDVVFAYSLETQRLTKVWFDPSPEKFNPHLIYSFLFKPVDLSHISGCRLLSTLTTTE